MTAGDSAVAQELVARFNQACSASPDFAFTDKRCAILILDTDVGLALTTESLSSCTSCREDLVRCDIVGPICELADFLARDRDLPKVQRGDLLAVFSAGAYGMSMTSNDHGRPVEVMTDGDEATVIGERQSLASVLEREREGRGLVLG